MLKINQSSPCGIGETISFLKKSWENFTNKWIAVSRGQLLGISDVYADLANEYEEEDVVIVRVV